MLLCYEGRSINAQRWQSACTCQEPSQAPRAELLGDGFKGQVWVTIHEPRWLLPPNMTATNWDAFPATMQGLAKARSARCAWGTRHHRLPAPCHAGRPP